MSRRRTLVTGFPSSFLARRVVQKLLAAEPSTRITCVVQTKFAARAEQALGALGDAERQRVDLLEGDIAAMDLGLSGREFRALAQEVDVIHHCAAVTYLGADRRAAERVNVGGTREVVELAEAATSLSRLVHWSTALVSGARRGYVLESELLAPAGFRNAIEETRYRAERIVQEAGARVPATVLRPATIVGDSRTGEIDRFEGPYLLVQLLLSAPSDLRLPLPGRGDVPLNLVPVDYAVDAGCAIARDPRSVGRTFHLVDPHPLTTRAVFERLAHEAGRPSPRGSVPTRVAAALLRAPGLDRLAQAPRAFLEQLGTEVVYDARNTEELLARTGIACPPFEQYVGTLVDAVRRQQAARRAQVASELETVPEHDDPLAD
jgi:thioester reductase-like protein